MEHFGQYELRRRIGVGGMAEVYEAVAFVGDGIEKPLVIKRILEEHSRDPAFRSMFAEEARIALGLSHPNIVQVFDFGKVDERVFLVMELVRGKDLGAILARMRSSGLTMPPPVAVFVAAEVAKGLDYAHRMTGSDGRSMNLVHRDVSPQNILVSTEGAVKIGDFGIAKAGGNREGGTVATTVRGKVRYMSPEAVEGKSIDGRSDLFSLGVVLYEMLTGKHVFDGASDYDVLDAVRRAKPVPPSRYVPLPTTLEKVVMKMLARDPRERYARGIDIARDLESFAARESMLASSEALADFLGLLFPELVRSSDEHGETVIRRLPEASVEDTVSGLRAMHGGEREGSIERTRIRRMPDDEEGMKVFVSEVTDTGAADTNASEVTAEGSALRDEPERPIGAVASSTPSSPAPAPASSTARARARNDATLARMPLPPPEPPEPPAEENTARPTLPEARPAAVARGADTDARPRARPAASPRRAPMPTAPPDVAESTVGGTTPPPAPRVEPRPDPPTRASDPRSRESSVYIERASARRQATGGGSRAFPVAVILLALGSAATWLAWQKLHLGSSLLGEEVLVAHGAGSRFGRLAIVGKKGDLVVVDNEPKGHLPLPPIVLTTGLHSVTVTGGVNADFAVNITDGETEDRTLADADPGDVAPPDRDAASAAPTGT
ncbi:MAG TPA: protein kinase [bacterium]|nr:protein kinase [bacterium]